MAVGSPVLWEWESVVRIGLSGESSHSLAILSKWFTSPFFTWMDACNYWVIGEKASMQEKEVWGLLIQ